MLQSIINNFQPFVGLSDSDKDKLVNNTELLTFRMGTYLFKQGIEEEYCYYLVEGKIDILSVDDINYAVYGG
ncbi:MAG: hypothetical protein GTO02_08895, partial [Candidatus Dadabacteria bacterium]|nr:hypothetical protein [Candidatus Dadabacteria bacterium]